MIITHSNGSKWYGQEPDSLEILLDVLSREPLDPRFEDYGNFTYRLDDPAAWLDDDGTPMEGVNPDGWKNHPGQTRFAGNFANLSHVFNIDTDEPEIIEKLTKAINENKARPDYQRLKAERLEKKEKKKRENNSYFDRQLTEQALQLIDEGYTTREAVNMTGGTLATMAKRIRTRDAVNAALTIATRERFDELNHGAKETPEERAAIIAVWKTLPGTTCYADALAIIAREAI